MIQEVKFQGLSHSPSDYEAQDGELGTCLNLINEDGALHPIARPVVVDENITIPDGASIELVHKVTHNDTIHSHYIIHRADDTWYWTERAGDGTANEIDLGGFKVNAVTAVGNILCFVGEENTLYAYCNGNKYITFDNTAFNYNATIKYDEDTEISATANLGDDWESAFAKNTKYNNVMEPTIKGVSVIFNALDAMVNEILDEKGKEYFKYTSFGVFAVRLYDGTSYINISNPFILAPRETFNKYIWRQETKAVSTRTSIHTHSVNVQMNIPEGLEDLIQGIDVFICQPESFIDTEKKSKGINRNQCFLYKDDMASGVNCDAFYYLSPEDIYKAFDSKSFFLSISIGKEKFGTDVKLKRVVETAQSISLANFNRSSFGGQCSITYNNRLHIGNIKQTIYNAFDTNIFANRKQIKQTSFNGQDSWFTYNHLFLNEYVDLPIDSKYHTDYICDAVFRVNISENSIAHQVYYKGKVQYPLSPIWSYPSTLATSMDIFFHLPKDGKYYRKTFTLRQSDSFGMSYYLNISNNRNTVTAVDRQSARSKENMAFGDRTDSNSEYDPTEMDDYLYRWHDDAGLPAFMQTSRYKLLRKETSDGFGHNPTTSIQYYWDTTPINTGDFTEITEAEYNEALAKVDSNKYISQQPNLIKVSEAENPLVFPAANSVQVGSSFINALAANTRPISEGQFGEAPLYAFTDEGVWVIMTSQEGTYSARQPVNREICINPKGILQIDDAVLFPTERGIMLQQGSETICITDALFCHGYPFDYTEFHKPDTSKAVLAINGTDPKEVSYIPFDAYLNNADMIFDYYDNRLILFNPDYSYAYVYSFKSKMWGTMKNEFKARVNIYPESYAVNEDNKIVNVYVQDPTSDVPYFLCSRPLSISTQEVYKTMFTCITRGYFRDENGKCGMVLYGSDDLFHWFVIHSSVSKYLRGMAGSPYKYFRIAIVGSLSPDESISGLSCEFQERWQNKLR